MVREFSTCSTAIRARDVYSSYIVLPDLPTFIPFCVGAPQFSMNYNQELSLKQNEQSFCPELNEESPVSLMTQIVHSLSAKVNGEWFGFI